MCIEQDIDSLTTSLFWLCKNAYSHRFALFIAAALCFPPLQPCHTLFLTSCSNYTHRIESNRKSKAVSVVLLLVFRLPIVGLVLIDHGASPSRPLVSVRGQSVVDSGFTLWGLQLGTNISTDSFQIPKTVQRTLSSEFETKSEPRPNFRRRGTPDRDVGGFDGKEMG